MRPAILIALVLCGLIAACSSAPRAKDNVAGALSLTEVQGVFSTHTTTLYKLFNQKSGDRKKRAGVIRLAFTISADGLADNLRLISSDVADTSFRDEVMRLVSQMQFPRRDSGTIVSNYPIYFIDRPVTP